MTGSELKAMRKGAGWTQKRLGAALGVHKVSVANWERDEYPIDQRTDIAIRAILSGAALAPSTAQAEAAEQGQLIKPEGSRLWSAPNTGLANRAD